MFISVSALMCEAQQNNDALLNITKIAISLNYTYIVNQNTSALHMYISVNQNQMLGHQREPKTNQIVLIALFYTFT